MMEEPEEDCGPWPAISVIGLIVWLIFEVITHFLR